jgi:phenylalanyl-tRNA synthetase beta chain
MKISLNWLKDYLTVEPDAEKIAGLLTGCGLEVENLEPFQSVKGGLDGVYIGEVITCVKHPNSDHLSLTTVDAGGPELLHIVCGAPNVAAGQKVAVAMIGTTLYFKDQEIIIQKTKIRGEVSEGMICSEDELGLGTSHQGILVLDPSALPGMPAKEYFKVYEDVIFEIGLTPNRSDAVSHFGIARDLVAVLKTLAIQKRSGVEKYSLKVPDVSSFKTDNEKRKIEVIIEDPDACPRYSGLTITGVTVRPSPQWLKNRLLAIGLRPINNIVDITNFLLHESGQPLHAFDADQIKGDKVIIKKLAKGTRFITLDEVERELTENDLMICNAEEPMVIAGVFGGIHSGVKEDTRNIFLESACFDAKSIRRTSKNHGLQTDASFRFERGADINITVFALKRAALMIREIAGGEISSGIVDAYPHPVPLKSVDLSFAHLDRLAGIVIDRDLVKVILTSVGMDIISESSNGLSLRIPSFKVDVTREADVIEEVLRIYGYDNINIPENVHSSISYSQKPDREKLQNAISDFLSSSGFYEIMNNSLTRSAYYENNSEFNVQEAIRIFNPLSHDLDVLRQTLLYNGLETITYNQNRKIADVKLFEFGTVYRKNPAYTAPGSREIKGKEENPLHRYLEGKHLSLFMSGRVSDENWSSDDRKGNFYDIKGVINNILMKAGLDVIDSITEKISTDTINEGLAYTIKGKQLVIFGSLSKALLKKFDCRQDVTYAEFNWDNLVKSLPEKEIEYRELPKFPEVRRDIALLLDRSVPWSEIEKLAFETEKKLLKKVGLFDVYEGEKIASGKKSYAMSFILQDEQKTLTDAEIDKVINKLIRVFEEKLHAQIR